MRLASFATGIAEELRLTRHHLARITQAVRKRRDDLPRRRKRSCPRFWEGPLPSPEISRRVSRTDTPRLMGMKTSFMPISEVKQPYCTGSISVGRQLLSKKEASGL